MDEGLRRLSELVILLAKNLLHARFPRGGVTYEGFNLMTKAGFEGSGILISDNNLPPHQADRLESPIYKNAVEMKASLAPELSEPGLNFILGSIDHADLGALSRIGRLSVVKDGKPRITITTDAELKHDGIDLLEAQIGLQLRNIRQPKHLYKA